MGLLSAEHCGVIGPISPGALIAIGIVLLVVGAMLFIGSRSKRILNKDRLIAGGWVSGIVGFASTVVGLLFFVS